jgi:hypothetical protein
MDFWVDWVLLLPWPYESDAGSKACEEEVGSIGRKRLSIRDAAV